MAKWGHRSFAAVGFAVSAVVAMPVPARANTINFESIAAGTTMLGTSVTEAGFEISHSGSFAQVLVNQGSPGDFSGNGTKRLISFNESTITVKSQSGELFDFTSFDGAESWVSTPHRWATHIRVTGYNALSLPVLSLLFALDLNKSQTLGFQTFAAGSGFTNLSSLEFTGFCSSGGCNPEFSIDNLQVGVNAVPDLASTLLLLSIGFAGVGAGRWRERRRSASAIAACRTSQ